MQNLIFGLLDCLHALLFFLPIFGERYDGYVKQVSLIELSQTAPYVKIISLTVISLSVLFGILTLALQNSKTKLRLKARIPISLTLSLVSVFFFTVSLEPYAAILVLLLLVIKAIVAAKYK